MSKKLSIPDSGYEDSSIAEGSSIEDYFNKFVPNLGRLVGEDEILDDPTIDLDDVALLPSPKPNQKTQRQKPHQPKMIMGTDNGNDDITGTSSRDLSLEEIGFIVGKLKTGGVYSDKLSTIMLKGLEKTLSGGIYKLFINYGLPENWCPIVKMNNDNTPFVEFLIKSDLSDQDPFSQLNEYSAEHMALCQFIVNKLHSFANHNGQPKQALTNGCAQLSCSTPKSQRQRILPPRACKSNKK